MARLTRAESQAQTRERLIASARDAFARNSYANTSIEEIAEGAGYSKGAFYSNFSTKETLALAIVRQDIDSAVDATSKALERARGNPDLMMSNIAALAASLSDNPERYILRAELMLHAARSPAFAAAFNEHYQRQHTLITELVALFFQQLNVAPLSPAPVLASAVLSLAQGHALLRQVGDQSTFGDTLRTLLDSAVHRARVTSVVAKPPAVPRTRARRVSAVKPRG